MNTFKKKSLYAALAGVGALGVTGAAQAVNVNPDGLGQVLIYPYYTVRTASTAISTGAFNSLLSVVNSTASAKAVKVRFLEGKNSREVLDFNLFLSPRDVWTAAIIPTTDGAGIVTADVSCTQPSITGTVPFVNYAYATGTTKDAADSSLDRTREGYVEIIEMGNLLGTVASTVTHSNGVPKCDSTILTDANITANITLGNGGLFGGMQLVNVNAGRATGVDPVALEAWRQAPATAIYTPPASTTPDLGFASPTSATVYTGGTATTYTFTAGIDAVSATLMHDKVMNEIVLDTATASGTDWVVTFPTKRFYVTGATVVAPFQRVFASSGACDDIGFQIWDREERTGSSPNNFSPPLILAGPALCWEANVVTFNNSNVLGSTNSNNINTGTIVTGYQNGWGQIDLANGSTGATTAHRLVSTSPVATFAGLPVVGFNAFTYNNGNVTTTQGPVRASYGLSLIHKYTRSIN
jgi:hypothetical protein